jgi:glycosyltransferase involved in cell wall biosynthesis
VSSPTPGTTHTPVERAAAQEAFAADLFAGVHRDGVAGTVLVVTGTADVQRRRHEVAAVCELARELIAAGHGVRVTDTADPALAPDQPAAHRSARLSSTVAVVATTAALDPAVVPAEVPVVGWVVDHTPRWLVNERLALFDSLVGGSSVVLARLRAALGAAGSATAVVDLRVAQPRADPTTFLRDPSGAGVQRELVTVIAGRPLGSFAIPLGLIAATGRLRIHAPLAAVPPVLRAHRREPLRAVDRPAAFADSIAVVFCDPEPVEVGDGVVGVAVSEAAAAGAVPLVRARVGLTEAGLGDALGFASPSSLGAALNGILGDIGATRARGARLAAAVARREPLGVWPAPAPAATPRSRPIPTVGFFPDLRVTNPYQDMLYAGLGAAGIRVAPVEDALSDAVLRDGGGRLDGYAFHLHWTSAIAQDGKNIFDAADRLSRFRSRVRDLHSRGGKLVWTIHNALPHELRYRDLELELCRFLAAEADLVHIMSAETVAVTAPHYALPPERTVLVAHSSYLGWYPDLVPRAEARRRLGLLPHEVALLALGGIRPYRGLDRLLEVFETLSAGDARLRLLVAGRPGPGAATQELVRRCNDHPRITVQFRHLPPSALQVWSRAADLAVLPYRAILNSGAFQLAQSFDLPVVAPRDGSLRGLLDPACTVGFDPADPVDLARAVRDGIALATDPERAAAAASAARAAATRYPPAAMAADFARALAGVLTR